MRTRERREREKREREKRERESEILLPKAMYTHLFLILECGKNTSVW